MDIGAIVAGRFEILAWAGAGGMANVYRARDQRSGTIVAVKTVRPEAGEHARHRFKREVRVLATTHHPAIVRYIAHGEVQGGPWLAMEWIEGPTLADRLRSGRLDVPQIVALSRRVAGALAALHHGGIVHRDIKPANLILRDNRLEDVCLIDLGIARDGDLDDMVTATGLAVGTPAYMSPEQARGIVEVDARSDVFSLGAVMYRCLAGRSLVKARDPRAALAELLLDEAPPALRPGTPLDLEMLLARMLAKDPGQRPHDGAAVLVELEALGAFRERVDSRETLDQALPSLSQAEQRYTCIVLAAAVRPHVEDTLLDVTADERPFFASLRGQVHRVGARLDVLADGSLVATLSGQGTAMDQAAQAARCALAIRDALPKLTVVVATGRALAGESVPIGEVLDRAAALLRSPGPAIALDAVTAALLDARFEVTHDAGAHWLLAEYSGVDAANLVRGRATPFVGRARELALLTTTLTDCVLEPSAAAVVMTGEAGAGKSRLMEEFSRIARDSNPTIQVWRARGDSRADGATLALLGRLVSSALELPTPATPSDVTRRVCQWIVDEALAATVAPFIGELVSVPYPDEHDLALRAARKDARLMADQTERAWLALVEAALERGPVLLLLDDLQWGDFPTVQHVDAALRVNACAPLFVIGIGRVELEMRFGALWAMRGAQQIRLGGLPPRAADALAAAVLGPEVDRATRARLVERASGNAFYLEELLRAAPAGNLDILPDTVLAMAQTRLSGLAPRARRVLRAAAIVGPTFWGGSVSALLGEEDTAGATGRVDEALDELVAQEVIAAAPASRIAGQTEYCFRHAIMADAAYAIVTDEDRALGHRLAADWLVSVEARDPRAIAEHYSRSDTPARSAAFWLRTAEQALNASDCGEAAERARRGVGSATDESLRAKLLLVWAEALAESGHAGEARVRAGEARVRFPEGSDRWLAAASLEVRSATEQGAPETLVTLCEQLCNSFDRWGTIGIRAVASLIHPLAFLGRHDLARDVVARVELAADALTSDDAIADVEVRWAHAALAMAAGDFGAFVEHAEATARLSELTGNVRRAAVAATRQAYGLMELGAHGRAEAILRDVIATAAQLQLMATLALAYENLGLVLARLGRFEEARHFEHLAIHMFEASGDRRLEGGARVYLARVEILAGDPATARRESERAASLLSAIGPMRGAALVTKARSELMLGDVAAALASARDAVAVLDERRSMHGSEAAAMLVLAEALEASGQREAARRALALARDELLGRAERVKDPVLRASFLANVPEHASILSLCDAWLEAGSVSESAAGPT